MNPEIQGKIEETVLDVLRNANLEETTEFKVRVAASERLGIDLSGKECRGFLRNLVENYLRSAAETQQSVREETKQEGREQQETRVKKEVNDDGDRHICEVGQTTYDPVVYSDRECRRRKRKEKISFCCCCF